MTMMRTLCLALIATTVTVTGVYAQSADSYPQLPFSRPMWERLKDNPAEINRLRSQLPPVRPGPAADTNVPVPPLDASGPPPVVGSFTTIPGPAGSPILMTPLVLTDGTVVAHVSCTGTWWKLTPDIFGNYNNGTWSTIASMPAAHTPRFYSSVVLPDGRMVIMGGEYNGANCNQGVGVWTNLGSIYDPVTNTWANVPPPAGWAQIGDSQATVLPNGTMFQANCCDPGKMSALLFAPALTWSATGTGKFDRYDEEGFTLLPNGTILTVDAYTGTGTCGSNTEVYDPATGAWTSAGNTPSILADCSAANAAGGSPTFEMGPVLMMYNGFAIAFGANTANVAHTALFNTTTSTWSAGPNLPSTCSATNNQPCTLADAPAVMLPNGKVLFAANAGKFTAPVNYFEYDPSLNSFAAVSQEAGISAFEVNFVILPTGQILKVNTDNSLVQVYNANPNTFSASLRPVVNSSPPCVAPNGTYTAGGTQFNGLSEGENYGDEAMAYTNFPLIRIVNNTTQHVFYARTFNHSNRSIAPGAASTTNFKVAAGTELGASVLYVVANGIPSVGTPVTVSSTCPGAPHDFDNNEVSDIVLLNTSQGVAMWLMNTSAQVASAQGVGTLPSGWSIVGQRDLNGGSFADLLLRNTDGSIGVWLMNGATIGASFGLGNPTSNWVVFGTGDFNNDGIGDILFRGGGTAVGIWYMNNLGQVGSIVGVGSLPNNWVVAGTGDFNGDGVWDILWTAGSAVGEWLMNANGTIKSVVGVGSLPAGWSIAGTGDVSGDGITDILLSAPVSGSTTVAVWFIGSNGSVSSVQGTGTMPSGWTVAQTGDFNGDHKADILWYNGTSGGIVTWLLNSNGTVASQVTIGSLPPSTWTIVTANSE